MRFFSYPATLDSLTFQLKKKSRAIFLVCQQRTKKVKEIIYDSDVMLVVLVVFLAWCESMMLRMGGWVGSSK